MTFGMIVGTVIVFGFIVVTLIMEYGGKLRRRKNTSAGERR